MRVEVVYTKNARKNLRNLQKEEARKIILKINFYSQHKNPLRYAKKLKPPFEDLYRFRIGDYRIIFDINKKRNITILVILLIKNRKEVY